MGKSGNFLILDGNWLEVPSLFHTCMCKNCSLFNTLYFQGGVEMERNRNGLVQGEIGCRKLPSLLQQLRNCLSYIINSVVKKIVQGWKGMGTVWKLAGSTILTPVLEHCKFCLFFWLQFFKLKVNPKSTGLFPPGTALGGVCPPVRSHLDILES